MSVKKLRDAKGVYHWPPPWIAKDQREEFPSVTTVLDETSGSDIAFAYLHFADQAKAELIDLVRAGKPGVRWTYTEDENHEEGGFWSKEEADALEILSTPGYLKSAALQKMRAAADRGLTTEDIFEQFLLEDGFAATEIESRVILAIGANRRCCTVEDCLPYAQSIWAWLDQMRPTAQRLQFMVFSRKYGYAGRVDGDIHLDGADWLIDLKTRSNGSARRSDGKQLGAYAYAEFTGSTNGQTWEESLAPKRRKLALLLCTPSRTSFRPYGKAQPLFGEFRHHLALWHSNREKSLLPARSTKTAAPAATTAAA